MNIVCVYTGNPNDCPECGGHNPTGQQFCSHDCAADRADREARREAAVQARRDAEDAFAVEVERLRGLGHTDHEIDELLKDMP